MTIRHFLSLSDAGGDAVAAMLADAIDRRGGQERWLGKLAQGRVDSDAPLAGTSSE